MSCGTDEPGPEPARDAIEGMKGPVLLEFGARWCGFCRALAPQLADLVASFPEVVHIKIEDGPGRPLGRSFGVKLWPNLVFLRNGLVVEQLARPGIGAVRKGLETITAEPGPAR